MLKINYSVICECHSLTCVLREGSQFTEHTGIPVFMAAPFTKLINGSNLNIHHKMRIVELLSMYPMRYLFSHNAALSPMTVHMNQRPLCLMK